MFHNIGGKIKTLAKVICWVGIALSIVLGLVLFITILVYQPVIGAILGMMVAIPTALLGAVLSWIGSFMLYGYGEMIELTAKIERNTKHS